MNPIHYTLLHLQHARGAVVRLCQQIEGVELLVLHNHSVSRSDSYMSVGTMYYNINVVDYQCLHLLRQTRLYALCMGYQNKVEQVFGDWTVQIWFSRSSRTSTAVDLVKLVPLTGLTLFLCVLLYCDILLHCFVWQLSQNVLIMLYKILHYRLIMGKKSL